jgi:hypothetical protein
MRILLAPVLVAGLGLLLASGESYAQVQPCTENCVQVSASSPEGEFSSGQTFQTTISFKQGGENLNQQAAIAITLGIPGLKLANCDNPTSDGLTSAIELPGEIADNFRVVVENTTCTDPSKPCLCPGTGETRADYINLVVFGPKTLPTPGSGEVTFPLLPADGALVTLSLTVDNPTTDPVPLHLYVETDNQAATPKPQFGALLSIGNNEAVDQTVNRGTSVSNVQTTDGAVNVIAQVGACACDCDGNMRVTGTEITRCVLILGQSLPLDNCPAADSDDSGRVTGTDITRGVIALGAGTSCVKYCNGTPCQQ